MRGFSCSGSPKTGGSLFRIIQDWIIPFRFSRFRFRRSGLLQDRVFDGAELTVCVADPLADHIAVFLQLPHPRAQMLSTPSLQIRASPLVV